MHKRISPDEGGFSFKKDGETYDDSWIATYNEFLLTILQCHCNVQVCNSIRVKVHLKKSLSTEAIKYLYKYHLKFKKVYP